MATRKLLDTSDHRRDSAGMTYVYPVVSRRAGGISVGINLNPNNACNWRCVYCQVPNLARGAAPVIALDQLERELRMMLGDIMHGDFMERRVPEPARRLNDIALSGNGEPTSAREFPQVIEIAGRALREFGLSGKIKLILITNGSLTARAAVQEGLRRMRDLNGEVWFKLDRATARGISAVNGARISMKRVTENLARAASLCPTWLQTCMFARDGKPPARAELDAYLEFVGSLAARGIAIKGVLLYGLARQPMQPEAARLTALPHAWMERFARQTEARGVAVRLAP